MVDIAKIEERINTVEAGKTEISMRLGGVQFQTMMELMEFAKLMSVSGAAVPVHLRGNPGACLAICTKALRFGFDPFSLAEHSMAMAKNHKNDKGQWESVETIGYDSFVIAAIIEAHAPIDGRLRISFSGEGEQRKCTVKAVPRGEKEPLEYESPPISEIIKHIGFNDKGNLKGSPLWLSNPDQQLAYWTRRAFCRRHFPETLLGWYDREELEENDFRTAKDITPKADRPKIAERLKKDKGTAGFKASNIDTALNGGPGPQSETNPDQVPATEPQPSAKSEPEPPSAADAYEAGHADRDKGKPLLSVPEQWIADQSLRDAWQAGWRSRDDELKPKPKAKSDTPMADNLGAG